jgi:HK97 family phage prohead protease
MKTKEIRKAVEVRFVREEGKAPHVEGYAAVFDQVAGEMFREVIRKGAFANCLKDNPDVRLLINHEGLPLARTKSGTLTLKEDDKGLFFSADLDASDPDVLALLPKLNRGDVDQCSFAFQTINDNWRIVDGVDTRELLEVDLSDVSIVTFPWYDTTEVGLRSKEAWEKRQKQAETINPEQLRLRVAIAEAE